MSVLSDIEGGLITKLDPLLIDNGGSLKAISIEAYKVDGDITTLLTRFSKIMPGGILSPADVDYPNTRQPVGNVQRIDMRTIWRFTGITSTKRDTEERKTFGYDLVDLFNVAIIAKDFAPGDVTPTFTFEPPKVNSFQTLETEEFYALIWQFEVRVMGGG